MDEEINLKKNLKFLENYNETMTIKELKVNLYDVLNELKKNNNNEVNIENLKMKSNEVQTKLVEESEKKTEEECCSVCGVTKSVYGFTFDINEKNELRCMNCWGKDIKC